MEAQKKPIAGFVISLIAGILILVGAIALFFVPGLLMYVTESATPAMEPEEIKEMEEGMAVAMPILNKILLPMAIVGLISAILIISGSFVGYRYPAKTLLGGLMVLIPSAIHIPIIIGILGVIGGALLIMKR